MNEVSFAWRRCCWSVAAPALTDVVNPAATATNRIEMMAIVTSTSASDRPR